MTGNLLIIATLSSVILAAIGARIAGGEPWKGAVLAVAFIAGTIAASFVAQSLVLFFIAGAVVAAIVAGAMKIPSKHAANALLGCILGQLVPFAFM